MNYRPLVAVIDDDSAMRDLVCHVLGTVGHDTRVFSTVEEFLDHPDMERIACSICDVRMPGIGGLGLLNRLSEDPHAPPVILFTAHGDAEMAVRALRAGAFEFLVKPFRDQDLIDQVQRALDFDTLRRKRRVILSTLQDRHELLTPREQEVFQMVVDGATNRAIAENMGLSQKTVEVHRAHMMTKMAAGSLPGLVRMAVALESVAGRHPLEAVLASSLGNIGLEDEPVPQATGADQ
jgi:FixJ family two-component response regulator